jgi:serine/threonine protein phosphatase 1
MKLDAFWRLFTPQEKSKPVRARPHLVAERWPVVLYAIGDVHGCLAQLMELEHLIIADARHFDGERWIVMLGDYVDRGPDSAGVIDHLVAPAPQGIERFCLVGNHETMMLDFIAAPSSGSAWLKLGGIETLASYGIDANAIDWSDRQAASAVLRSMIPSEHIEFLRRIPLYLSLPNTVLVHGGVRPGIPLDEQVEEDLLWIRPPFHDAARADGLRVVHGHTPSLEPVVTPFRIGVDTGAYATGRLTAVRLEPGSHAFFSVGPAA